MLYSNLFGEALPKSSFGNAPTWIEIESLLVLFSPTYREPWQIGSNSNKRTSLADNETISSFHERTYVRFVKKDSEYGRSFLDIGDIQAFNRVFEAVAQA